MQIIKGDVSTCDKIGYLRLYSNSSSVYEAAEKVGIVIKQLPPPSPPYTGGELITKRFPLLCKEGLGVVVQIMGLFQSPRL